MHVFYTLKVAFQYTDVVMAAEEQAAVKAIWNKCAHHPLSRSAPGLRVPCRYKKTRAGPAFGRRVATSSAQALQKFSTYEFAEHAASMVALVGSLSGSIPSPPSSCLRASFTFLIKTSAPPCSLDDAVNKVLIHPFLHIYIYMSLGQ